MDEVVKDAVETEFYRYLRVKKYTATQVEKQMSTKKLNSYHHQAISSTKQKLEREKKQDEEIAFEAARVRTDRVNETEAEDTETVNGNNLEATGARTAEVAENEANAEGNS